jgi:hypothetical protein
MRLQNNNRILLFTYLNIELLVSHEGSFLGSQFKKARTAAQAAADKTD